MKALIALGLLTVVAGCGSGKDVSSAQPTGKATASAVASASAPAKSSTANADASTTPTAAPTAAASADIPTQEDYEDKAAAAISSANADQELSKLEKEMGK